MSDEKKKKKEELKLNTPLQVSAEVGYVQEQAVKNADIVSTFKAYTEALEEMDGRVELRNDNGEGFNVVFDEKLNTKTILKDDKIVNLFGIPKLKERFDNGESIDNIISDMENYILENKNTNPENVMRAITIFCGYAENHYDDNVDSRKRYIADSFKDGLSDIMNLSDCEALQDFVCVGIHTLLRQFLDGLGINAVTIGGDKHVTFLWQRGDGKYVQTNYGKSYVLNAPNVKDAVREVLHQDLGLENSGYIGFYDGKGSYREFSLKDEAVWGDELDKRDYNNRTPFDHSIEKESSVTGRAYVSNLGSVSAEAKATLAYGNETRAKETSFSLGYKSSGKTSLADSSKSVGFKLEHNTEKQLENGRQFSEITTVADLTKLHTNSVGTAYSEMQTVDHYDFTDEEQAARYKACLSNQYEQSCPLSAFENRYNYLQDYLNHDGKQQPPVSQDEYIKSYSELDDETKKQHKELAIAEWNNYLIKNNYAGAEEYAQQQADYYKDHVENYNKYRNEDIDIYLQPGASSDKTTATLHSIDMTHLTLFGRYTFGREKQLLNDKGVMLTNGWKLSGTGSFNGVLSYKNNRGSNRGHFYGDLRLAAEDGIKLDVYDNNSIFSTTVSGGITADLSRPNGVKLGVSPGAKLNGGASYQTKLGDKTTVGVGTSACASVTRPAVETGVSGQILGNYKLNKDVTIFGSASLGNEKQRLRVGGFNEQTENVTTIGATLGAQLGKRGTVSLNYTNKNDKLNSTRNRQVFSIGANITL